MAKTYQLHELTHAIAMVVNASFPTAIWVVAEVSDMQVRANGHCYMQLVEKDERNGTMRASVRGIIWANRWWMIRDGFKEQTGQDLQNGLKVMLQVQVNMHEQYGLSLNIVDYDATYTLGEMAKRRLDIIRRLTEEGVIDMNRELPFPALPQRIAIISAEGAAGYGDFCKQLDGNGLGIKFYTHLFKATMQGKETEPSVIRALDRIGEHQDLFDVVVIIRGGGATADLSSFDYYEMALNVANFPLPVITGIGHDRDQTVLDRVAHTSVKTPTAAAALLIDAMTVQLQELQQLEDDLRDGTEGRMERERQQLQRLANAVRGTHTTLTQNIGRLDMTAQRISMLTRNRMEREHEKLQYMEQTIKMAQPDNILRRGFSITRLDGHAVMSAAQVPAGAVLSIQTSDGKFDAVAR